MRCAIRYHLYNFKNVKNTRGGVLLKLTLLHGCFSHFLNCTNGIKSRNTSNMFYLPWSNKFWIECTQDWIEYQCTEKTKEIWLILNSVSSRTKTKMKNTVIIYPAYSLFRLYLALFKKKHGYAFHKFRNMITYITCDNKGYIYSTYWGILTASYVYFLLDTLLKTLLSRFVHSRHSKHIFTKVKKQNHTNNNLFW